MAESVIEEVLALKRWMVVSVVLSLLSFLILGGIAIGLKVAVTTVAEEATSRLDKLAGENKQLRDANAKLQQQGARKGY